MNRFKKHHDNIVCYDLLFKDHFINVMQLPKIDHITLNTGIGLKAILDKKQILTALLGSEFISGQRPIITRAKKSIDKFKLREKMPIGCKVTLRSNNLYESMDRLINTVIPLMDNSHELFSSDYFKNLLASAKSSHLSLSRSLKQKEESVLSSVASPSINSSSFHPNSISAAGDTQKFVPLLADLSTRPYFR
jgi:hypothetical protein